MPQGVKLGRLVTSHEGAFWLHATRGGPRVLLVAAPLRARIDDTGFASEDLAFGDQSYGVIVQSGAFDEISRLDRPEDVDVALGFARALGTLDDRASVAIYSGEAGKMLSFVIDGEAPIDKDLALGRYLSAGIDVPASDVVALERITTAFDIEDLEKIVTTAGVPIKSARRVAPAKSTKTKRETDVSGIRPGPFTLPGRSALSEFFNEHVVEIIADEERYAALGIGFPGGIILEGPTGCGKTFAVEKLIEHLGWPSFSIDASSVASPYIHETSRKVAEIFTEAKKAAPCVIVIDEMDAFLADRSASTDQHRVEEVAEFLRRIPEASANRVLIIGMTNKIDLIDPAIRRRGRFDHVIHVEHAGPAEVEGLLGSLLSSIPHDLPNLAQLAAQLAGRPLSDAAYVVREAGRLAARAGRDQITEADVAFAISRSPERDGRDQNRIGF
ncbi:ATP-binding protein [Sphingobium sp. CFD-2]|uniref:ATP-binding protein n=1 Tax=Sphingobium sp. CFD-2 TaxID=2878542 RepID=UPI00214A91FC|nr:AAA family ATPase [Sphingobium sp. CFD-2]